MSNLLNVAKPFEGWQSKAEEWLCRQFPQLIDSGRFSTIAVGRNSDADIGGRGGFRVKGRALQNSALYLETPSRVVPDDLLADPTTRVPSTSVRIDDSVAAVAREKIEELRRQGLDIETAQARIADAIPKIAYFDPKSRQYIAEAVVKGVNDSILSGLQTPYWNVSVIQKIFKQPFLEGYAKHLVSPIGVPNIWADIVQIFTETFEGFARVSNVAHSTPEFNTSITAKNKTGTMVSELINLVIEFETSENEQIVGSQNGNWLTGATMGDREAYARLMLEQLMNTLIYFGHAETGFDGLTQIANRDGYYEFFDATRPPLQQLWDDGYANPATNATVGADAVMMMNRFIAEMMEELNFLPVSVNISCSPIVYKVLKWALYSKVYDPSSPLKILSANFSDNGRINGTMASASGNALQSSYSITPDPMLMPGTPFNATDEDLMFITFPTLQSAMSSGLDSLVMAPTAIDFMVLPNWPHRDGILRTGLKRIGSLLCPVAKCVKVVSGFGTNSRYVP